MVVCLITRSSVVERLKWKVGHGGAVSGGVRGGQGGSGGSGRSAGVAAAVGGDDIW